MGKLTVTAEPGKQEVVLTRVFDAPRELLFKAMTDPKAIPEWWGPKNLKTTVDKMDVKKGGIWRYIHTGDNGNEDAFNGVYHEVLKPERLTYTFEWEGLPGHILLETITFQDLGGKTKMVDKSVFQSVEDRDGMISSGMEEGSTASMDRLAEYVAKMK